jgi:hypothetical protein
MRESTRLFDYRSPTTSKVARRRFNREWAAGFAAGLLVRRRVSRTWAGGFLTGVVLSIVVAGLLLLTFVLFIQISGD